VLKHLKEYTNNSDKKTPDDNTPTMDPTITATSQTYHSSQVTNHHGDGNHVTPKKPSTSKNNNETRCGQIFDSRSNSKNEVTPTPQISKWRNGNVVALPLNESEKQPVGLVFSAIGKNSQCIEIAENHAQKCAGNRRLHLSSRVKSGFQLIETFGCGFCKREYKIKSGPTSDPSTIKKKGGQVSEICKIIGHSAYHAALTKTMLGEFLDQAGCVRPSDTALHSAFERVKSAVKNVSLEQLRENRIEHVKVIRETNGTKYDVEFIDSNGQRHVICCGQVSSDGGGETRAYQHRITGHQHCTIIFSGVTGKPLAIKHDQLSCVHCTLTLTKVINDGKRAHEITEEDLKHPGKKCYRSTKYSPASAEEHAMEYLGGFLLVDPITKKLRPDNIACNLSLHPWTIDQGVSAPASVIEVLH